MKKILTIFLVFIIIFSVIVLPASAASAASTTKSYNYNSYFLADVRVLDEVKPFVNDSYYFTLFAFSDGSFYLAITYVPCFTNSTGKVRVNDSGGTNYHSIKLYSLSNGSYEYGKFSTGTITQGSMSFGSFSEVVWTSYSMSNLSTGGFVTEGDSNFIPPLYLMILGKVERILSQVTMPALGGVMKTILLCGVGLMACMMGLVVFTKVFHPFRLK